MAKDVITRFKLETTQYDSKIKEAAKTLSDYAKTATQAKEGFDKFTKSNIDAARALGTISTTTTNAKDKVKELVSAYNEAAKAYNQLTREQQQSDFGRALSGSLTQLQQRIRDTKTEMQGLGGGLGKLGISDQFSGVINKLGREIGISGELTSMLTSKTAMLTGAVGASIAIVGKAADEWKKYNSELAKQDQVSSVTTGMSGPGSKKLTDSARAMVDTYGVDFREVVNAANTLMAQFGETGDNATQIIRKGLQGMILGDGPKLLSMIQQFAPAFRDAGVSASQLVAVIQNSEGGVFTDQNMNAIVMGIKNIRLMTDSTSQALAKMGIDGKKMSQDLSNGTITIFDALKQVAGSIDGVNSSSKAAGEVMQQVFGRQGAMAGTKLGEAIATLNTNLEETRRQTGELGNAYDELYKANEKLNKAIRDCFEYDGWEQMATGIQAKLVSALAWVVQKLGDVKAALGGLTVTQQQGDTKNGGGTFIDRAVDRLKGGSTPGKQNIYQKQVQEYSRMIIKLNEDIRQTQLKAAQDMTGNMASVYEKQIRDLENRKKAIENNLREYKTRGQKALTEEPKKNLPDPKPAATTTAGSHSTTKKTTTEEKSLLQQNEEAIRKLVKEYQDLSVAEKVVGSDAAKSSRARLDAIRKEIDELKERNEELRKYEQEAKGELPEEGSKRYLEVKKKELTEKQVSVSQDSDEWYELELQIKNVEEELDALDAKIPKGKEAVISITVDRAQLDKALSEIPEGLTVRIDEVEGKKYEAPELTPLEQEVDEVEGTPWRVPQLPPTEQDVDMAEGSPWRTPDLPDTEQRVNMAEGDKWRTPDLPDITQTVNEKAGATYTPPTLPDLTQTVNEKAGTTYTPPTLPDVTQNVDMVDGKPWMSPIEPPVEQKVDMVEGTPWQSPKLPDVTQKVVLTGATDSEEILRKIRDKFGKDLKIKYQIEGTTKGKLFSENTVDDFIASTKKKLKDAEYGSEVHLKLADNIEDAENLKMLVDTMVKNNITGVAIDTKALWDRIINAEDVNNADWQAIVDVINDKLAEINPELKLKINAGQITTLKEGGEKTADAWRSAAGAISSVGNAIGQIEDPTARIVAMVAQAIAGVAQGAGMAISTAGKNEKHWAGYLAAAAAITAQMVTMISTIHSATGYAQGGKVVGNSYSGDNIIMPVGNGNGLVGLDAGEVVLNRAQQGNLASQLNDTSRAGLNLDAVITAEQIRLILRHNAKRTGRSETIRL